MFSKNSKGKLSAFQNTKNCRNPNSDLKVTKIFVLLDSVLMTGNWWLQCGSSSVWVSSQTGSEIDLAVNHSNTPTHKPLYLQELCTDFDEVWYSEKIRASSLRVVKQFCRCFLLLASNTSFCVTSAKHHEIQMFSYYLRSRIRNEKISGMRLI